MKRLAFLCLVLTTGTIALAQQPAEWRPNIVDDNKAATWVDTFAFLTNTVSAASSPWCDNEGCRNGTSTVELLPGPGCTLHLKVNSVDYIYPQFHHEQEHLV